MSDPRTIIEALEPCRTILISVHRNPDGDALGSQLALMLALEKMRKTVTAHNLDPVPEVYRFLPQADRIRAGRPVPSHYDAHIVLDGEPSRTGLFDGTYPAHTLINIDHHVTNPRSWQLTWLDEDASATGEMIYKLIRHLDVPIDRDIALCLFTSIFTDTGSFRYTNTTPECMRISAELLEAGADPWLVTENVYESFAFRRIKLLGAVLSSLERSADGRVAWVVVTDELYRRTGTTSEDTENFINFVRSIKGVEVAVLLRQIGEAQYKISLRSKGRVDLSALAQSFGGGGHKNAAGGVMSGTIEVVTSKVINEVDKAVRAQLGSGSRIP
ncbi:MAG TPA: bifunctional oligoribonuclease/PAP phosphatase NrnA, partial [Nitrospirota bacterium]|nr:bifunctional oligoribonuclease/PAP phosphatase NrnA [Nitrospirota bacterium]